MRYRISALAFSLFFVFEARALVLTELYVTGLAAAERDYVVSILPFARGEDFATRETLEGRARLAEAWLRQDGRYAAVSIEVDLLSENEAGVYVFLQEASIRGLDLFGSSFTVIPHFPFYQSGFGFLVGAYEQLLCLDFPLSRRLGFDIVSGHAQAFSGTQAFWNQAGLNYRPLPLLRLDLPFEASIYAPSGGGAPLDLALGAGGTLDLSFLETTRGVGATFATSFRKGLGDYDYTAIEGGAVLSFRPHPLLSLRGEATVSTLEGNPPPLRSLDDRGKKILRVAPNSTISGNGLVTATALGILSFPGRLGLGIMSVGVSAYGFYEISESFAAPSDLARGSRPASTGGGLMIELSPPFSLTIELGYGYSIAENRSALIINVK